MNHTTDKTWGANPKISDLPIELQVLAVKNQIKQGNKPDTNKKVVLPHISDNFSWDESNEGEAFWLCIDRGECPVEIPNPWPFKMWVSNVGKCNARKFKNRVTIIGKRNSNLYPFLSDNGLFWKYAVIPTEDMENSPSDKLPLRDGTTYIGRVPAIDQQEVKIHKKFYPKISKKNLCKQPCLINPSAKIGSLYCQGCANFVEKGRNDFGQFWIKCAKMKEAIGQ